LLVMSKCSSQFTMRKLTMACSRIAAVLISSLFVLILDAEDTSIPKIGYQEQNRYRLFAMLQRDAVFTLILHISTYFGTAANVTIIFQLNLFFNQIQLDELSEREVDRHRRSRR
jgi:hypothetical protein